jgi:spermidine synthase
MTNPPTHRWILVHLAAGGVCTVAVEVAAFRLLAPSFGSTQFITTNVLGVVLASLAAGYWIGGRVADRAPRPELLYYVSAAAAALLVALPFAADPVLEAARPAISRQNASLFAGTLAAMTALFALPMLLLGMISPFTVRLLARGDAVAGRQSGLVFSLSTVGSIVGAYLPSLVTIPWIGTRGTIQLFGGLVLFTSAIGAWLARRRIAGGALLFFLAVPATLVAHPMHPALPPGILEERETEYHVVRVVRDEANARNLLEINEGLSFHSMEFDDGRISPAVWGYFQLFPLLLKPAAAAGKPPLKICIIGLAAGTVATHLQRAYGDVFDMSIDGVEIDRDIVELGRKYFRLEEKSLRVHIEDGRTFLARTPEMYDLVIGDAYRQPYIPAHLVTREFFELVRDRLKPGGIFVLNVGSLGTDSPALRAIQNALIAAFPGSSVERFEVVNLDVPFSNYVCMVSATPLRPRLEALATSDLEYHKQRALDRWTTLATDPGAPILTDDHCPVEWYTDLSLLQFAAGK